MPPPSTRLPSTPTASPAALAVITNILDPDAIVLGGGLSNLPNLAENLPALMRPYIFTDTFTPNITRNAHGDSSGVRGAAWLWPA